MRIMILLQMSWIIGQAAHLVPPTSRWLTAKYAVTGPDGCSSDYMIKPAPVLIQDHHYSISGRFVAMLVVVIRPRGDFQGATCLAALFHRIETCMMSGSRPDHPFQLVVVCFGNVVRCNAGRDGPAPSAQSHITFGIGAKASRYLLLENLQIPNGLMVATSWQER